MWSYNRPTRDARISLVGDDLLQVVPLNGGRAMVVIGDVNGKGISAREGLLAIAVWGQEASRRWATTLVHKGVRAYATSSSAGNSSF